LGQREALLTVLATAAVTVPATAAATWWWMSRPAQPDPALPDTVGAATGEMGPLARAVAAPAMQRTDISAWASGMERVAATDLDGDGHSEVALAGAADLRVVDLDGRLLGDLPAPGAITVLEGIGDAIFAGWGRGKAFPDAGLTITRTWMKGQTVDTQTVATPHTSRPQPVAIQPAGADLLVAWFGDTFTVTVQRAVRSGDGWALSPWTLARTAPTWLVVDLDGDGHDDLVRGRTYGDQTASDGDASVLLGTGQRVAIPTTRGVRAGCLADTDGDGRPEVVLADGWHKDYGRKARAQIRLAWWADAGIATAVLDESPGDNDVSRVLGADIDGDGKDEILAVTNSRLRVVEREDDGWIAWDAASGVADAAVARTTGGSRVIVVGKKPEYLEVRR